MSVKKVAYYVLDHFADKKNIIKAVRVYLQKQKQVCQPESPEELRQVLHDA